MPDSKLETFRQKLREAKKNAAPEEPASNGNTTKTMNMGMRVFVELIGVILGSGLIGLMLDRFFETAPLFLIILIFLGICAGIYNTYKIATKLGTAIGTGDLKSVQKDAKQSQKDLGE